jgi:ParB/RepB/Spo0J family partition protein
MSARNTPSDASKASAQEIVRDLPREKCHVSERNTRQPTEKDVLASGLVASLKQEGQITPGIVRPHPKKPGHYEIGAGSRRYVAGGPAGLASFKAVIREMDDSAFDILILTENFQRENPGPKEEAVALQRLHEAGIRSTAEIAAALGQKEHWVKRRLQLLKVIPEGMKQWQNGSISHFNVEMMELLGSLPAESQKEVLKESQWVLERFTNRAGLEKHLHNRILCSLQGANWLDDPDTFVKGCGPGCAHDSSKTPELFDASSKDKKSCGTCLHAECFFARRAKARAKQFNELMQDGGEKLPLVTTDWHIRNNGIDVGQKEKLKPSEIDSSDLLPVSAHKNPKLLAGARKVIFIESEAKMTVRYLKPAKKEESSSGGSAAAQRLTASPKQKEKERKEALQAKRWVVVLDRLKKALAAAPWDQVRPDGFKEGEAPAERTIKHWIGRLVAHFGLPYKIEHRVNDFWKGFDEMKFDSTYHYQGNKNKPADHWDVLWGGLKEIFNRNFTHHRVGDVLAVVPHMRRVAQLIGFDLDAEKTKVDLEILPPKSWGPTDPHTLNKPTAAAAAAAASPPSPVKPKSVPAKKAAKKTK